MAEGAASSSAAPPAGELHVNISIVSPSLGVNAPLSFSDLPVSTTVGQLKQKIRDALDSKPSNDRQRLIHQGKLLAKEHETFLEVFGEQRIRDASDSDQFAVHLVIRDIQDHHQPSTQPTATPNQNTAAPRNPLQPTPPPHFHAGQRPRVFGRPAPMPGHAHSPFPAPQFGMSAPLPGATADQMAAQQRQTQILQQYINQMNQRFAMAPGEQARAGAGQGVPDTMATQGRNSPHPEHQFQPQHYTREGVGPNGEIYRVTMNSAFIGPNGQVHAINMPGFQQGHVAAAGPGGPFSTNDVQNILRSADANQATSMMTNAMHRSASGASLANLNLNNQRQPIQTPGVTVPRRPGSAIPLSRTATPDTMRTPSHGSSTAQAHRASTPNQPEVYILSSPQGPRALLVNGPSDLYFTPQPRVAHHHVLPHFSPAWVQPQSQHQPQHQPRTASGHEAQPLAQPQAVGAPVQQQNPQEGNIRVGLYQGPAAQQPGQQQQQQQQARLQPLPPGAAVMHPGNPEGGVAGALLAALWPHVWLLIRLAVFVWWFTSANTTWTRWLIIMFLATVVFLANTGLFNGVANDLFNPIRQHLEGLIPFAGPERRNNPPAADGQPAQGGNNGPVAEAGQRQGEPDPAQAAARLVEQRREQNANWLLDQIRRVERAGLLLLASILPGVAERHIAHLEAEARAERDRQEAAERAERQRREEEERAAAEAAAAAANGSAEGQSADGATGDQQNSDAPASGAGETEQQQHQPVAAA